jgi:spermidine synthase
MPVIPNNELMARLTNGVFVETACSADTHTNYPLGHVAWAGRTAFQEVVIADSATYGRMLFLDGEIQSSSSDEAIYHEHLVHPVLAAMASSSEKRVLVVGGGEGATVREVLRWDPTAVSHVDWVDIDGDLVSLCREHLKWAGDSVYNDPRLMFYPEDINTYLDRTDGMYDVIILDLPDPDVESLDEAGAESDVLYGPRFRERIMSHLSAGGAIVSHCGPIRPGRDEANCAAGMVWMREQVFGGIDVFPYHVCIPSFQGTWGFMMTVAPKELPQFPSGLRVMDSVVEHLAFTWPDYWTDL